VVREKAGRKAVQIARLTWEPPIGGPPRTIVEVTKFYRETQSYGMRAG